MLTLHVELLAVIVEEFRSHREDGRDHRRDSGTVEANPEPVAQGHNRGKRMAQHLSVRASLRIADQTCSNSVLWE